MKSNRWMIDSDVKELLIEFYNNHSEDLISIWVGGSAILPYISSPHDIDIILIWKNLERRKIHLRECVQLHRQLKDTQYSCLNWYVEQYETAFKDKWPVYAYLFDLCNLIIGNDFEIWHKFKILEYQYMAWQTIVDLIENAHNKKWFYHILTTLYILWNQSYELTNEQIENIVVVHDQQDQEKIEELYQWALQQIQE